MDIEKWTDSERIHSNWSVFLFDFKKIFKKNLKNHCKIFDFLNLFLFGRNFLVKK